MIRVALRASSWPAIGMAGLVAVVLAFMAAAYAGQLGDRAKIARDLESLAQGFSFILPLPSRLDTVAGYMEWFGFGQVVPILATWAALLGTGASRADEERGLTDQWLASGIPRWRVLSSQLVAFALASTVAVGTGDLAGWLTTVLVGEPVGLGAFAMQTAGLLALMLVSYCLGLAMGQLFATRRGAAGSAVALLLSLFFLNSLSRQSDALVPYRWLSPFSYYDRVHGLVAGVAVDPFALAALALGAATLFMLATLAFARRDVGTTLIFRRSAAAPMREPSTNALLRTPTLSWLYDQRAALVVWSAAIAVDGSFTLRLGRSFLQTLSAADPNDPRLGQLRIVTGAGHGAPYEGFLGFEWFGGIFALGLSAFAVTQVARWAGDDADGRLEALLSTPVSRSRVVVERALSLLAGAGLLVLVGHTTIALGTKVEGVELDPGRMAAASSMLLGVAGVFGSLGAALSAWRPRVAIAGLSAFAFLSFMIPFATPVVQAPGWVQRLSVFDLYGTPLADGFELWRAFTLCAITALGFAAAVLAMRRRDVGR